MHNPIKTLSNQKLDSPIIIPKGFKSGVGDHSGAILWSDDLKAPGGELWLWQDKQRGACPAEGQKLALRFSNHF